VEAVVNEPHLTREDQLAAELRLRPEHPPVTRLSRKVLATLGAVAATAILGALVFALQSRSPRQETTELHSTDHKTTAEELEPAALITGIRSDLPGEITAQVTENVYDSPSGKFLLIPQEARLIGQYDSQISFGQSRVLLMWTRIIMPNGASIVLEHQPGADSAGYAGLEDDVDYHWGNLAKAAAISTLLGIASELVLNSNNSIVQALRTGAENTVNQTGQTLVSRQLNVQPTLTIRPGFPVRVVVNRDLVFAPYKG
jgi:type IV secretion system protein TrbI